MIADPSLPADLRSRSSAGPPRGIVSPAIDALCAGGASIVAVAVLLALDPSTAAPILLGKFAFLGVLLNWPHFMASYHLLYSTPGAARKHAFAAVYVPALLLGYALAAAVLYGREPLLFYGFHALAAVYLAWHYTGQTWGMMSAFAHVEGLGFDAAAQGLVRANLRVLLAWHAVWSVHTVAAKMGFARFALVYQALSMAALASAALGAAGLWRLRRTAGRLPPRVLLPWIAIHAWYALIYRYPLALFWVQLSHASQYLIFPLRVQANRQSQRDGREPSLRRSALYYFLLTASGWAAFKAAPYFAGQTAQWSGSAVPAGVLVIDLLNIHHYFIDGCIWKLKNPEVRRDLFRHLDFA